MLEAKSAQCGYAIAFRRLVKRRYAVSQAYPYVVGTVALATSWVYRDGVLCYTFNEGPQQWLRIIDLQRTPDTEVVVDIYPLVKKAVLRDRHSDKYVFRVLHHAAGITSCLFKFRPRKRGTECWLLVFKADEQFLFRPRRIDRSTNIFVRNNADFLYYGTQTERISKFHYQWSLHGFSIKDNKWSRRGISLDRIVQREIGSTICFEIVDGYFYVISNRHHFGDSFIRANHYYTCFRFRAEDMVKPKFEHMEREQIWRRSNSEGYWHLHQGFLRLGRNEDSGVLQIIESGREKTQEGMQRTYYTKELVFPEKSNHESGEQDSEDDGQGSGSEESEEDSDGPEAEGDEDDGEESGSEKSVGEETETSESDWESESVSDTRSDLEAAHQQGRSPNTRSAHDIHPGDNRFTLQSYPINQTHLCDYHKSSNTFMDLVNDIPAGDNTAQYMRLRAGTRRAKPPSASMNSGREPIDQLSVRERTERLYFPTRISVWPPAQDPSNPNPQLDLLNDVLNPPAFRGAITAVGDDRSIVYSTGADTRKPKPLIYISFDPSARLDGMERWGTLTPERSGGPVSGDSGRVIIRPDKGKDREYSWPVGRDLGKGREEERDPGDPLLSHERGLPLDIPPSDPSETSWARFESPMYKTLSRRFSFNEVRRGRG